jgi:hypothetical protein
MEASVVLMRPELLKGHLDALLLAVFNAAPGGNPACQGLGVTVRSADHRPSQVISGWRHLSIALFELFLDSPHSLEYFFDHLPVSWSLLVREHGIKIIFKVGY